MDLTWQSRIGRGNFEVWRVEFRSELFAAKVFKDRQEKAGKKGITFEEAMECFEVIRCNTFYLMFN
jgi:hypothetical protein